MNKTKQRLVEATLELLKTKSGHLLTIREIAKEADLNSACISYHFGSRENLIAEASQFFWKQWDDMLDKLTNSEESLLEKLKKYLCSYLNYILKYDGIFKNYIAQIISQEEFNNPTNKNIKKQEYIIRETIKELTKIEDEQVLKFKATAILSSIVYPALLGNYGVNSFDLDIYNKELQKKYIDEIVGSILNVHKGDE